MARRREAPGVPPVIERFVKALVVTAKAVALYPPSSKMPLQTAEGAESVLREALRERSGVRVTIGEDSLLYRDETLFPGSGAYQSLAAELHRRGLAEVRFHSGTRARDIVGFLSILRYEPVQIETSGGVEARLWERGVATITVAEVLTPRSEAAQRLLDTLGDAALEPLLEQLAEEQDLGVRTALVEALSRLAPRHVGELGARVSDPRWYVARNVVCILGSTGSAEVLPHLQRSLSHPEQRVRRETIRALSRIEDDRASTLLVRALGDEDDQNVQLAARYLGSRETDLAVAALAEVALGEGDGDRSMGPRVEAIEALGRIGDRAAFPALRALAGKRTVIRTGRARELRVAAEAAIVQITEGNGIRQSRSIDIHHEE